MSPILPSNRRRYPADWPEIRQRILQRARHRCEECGVRNHSVGYRERDGSFIPLRGNGPCDFAGDGESWPDGRILGFGEALEIAEVQNCCADRRDDDGHRWIVIVLTVAHLDHLPEHCDDDNLKALCQQCHNRHDRRHRDHTRRFGTDAGQLELPAAAVAPSGDPATPADDTTTTTESVQPPRRQPPDGRGNWES